MPNSFIHISLSCGMGTEEIPHIDEVNATLKIILGEIKAMNETLRSINNKIDKN